MAARLKLTAKKRKVLGRKVKKLRREGILPANLYGKKVKSQALELPLKDFMKVYDEVGETGLVDLKTNGKAKPVLIHNVQVDPVTSAPIHADFHQATLTEKTTADIPIELVGESPAVEQKIGILIQSLSEVEVEALPADLPDRLTVNISNLKEIDDAVTVGDLMVETKKVKVLVDKGQIVAKIEPPAKEEEVAPPPAEEEVPPEEVPEEERPPEEEVKVPAEEKKPPEEARAPKEGEKPAGTRPPARPEGKPAEKKVEKKKKGK